MGEFRDEDCRELFGEGWDEICGECFNIMSDSTNDARADDDDVGDKLSTSTSALSVFSSLSSSSSSSFSMSAIFLLSSISSVAIVRLGTTPLSLSSSVLSDKECC